MDPHLTSNESINKKCLAHVPVIRYNMTSASFFHLWYNMFFQAYLRKHFLLWWNTKRQASDGGVIGLGKRDFDTRGRNALGFVSVFCITSRNHKSSSHFSNMQLFHPQRMYIQGVQLKSGPCFNMNNLFTEIYNMLSYTTNLYLQ